MNHNIRYPKVYVIPNIKGDKPGVKNTKMAIELAKSRGLDLVVIAVKNKIPVAKMVDYGKFKYNRKKKSKILKEKQTIVKNREVRITPLIGQHDLETKAKSAHKFLERGNRVKVSLKFRGRELGRKDLGFETLDRFYKLVEDIALIESQPKMNNFRFLDMYLVRDKKKAIKGAKNAKNEDQKSTS